MIMNVYVFYFLTILLFKIMFMGRSQKLYQYCDIGTKKSKCFKTPNM